MEITAMGGFILIFLLAVLLAILVLPALRVRAGRATPPGTDPDAAHEVVVHQLDDHRGKKKPSADDAQKPQG
jgi:hypothetical protein